jgi:hypothetical protein
LWGKGQSAETQRTNPVRHRDISTKQPATAAAAREGSAPALADRWRRAQAVQHVLLLCSDCSVGAWARARACVAPPCKSQPCSVILVTQEMRVRETVVSLYAHRRHRMKRRALEDGEMVCPPLRPALSGCSAIFKHMPPVSRVVEEEEQAHKNGTWGASHSRDGVRHACIAWGGSCVVPGGRGIARVVVKGLTA